MKDDAGQFAFRVVDKRVEQRVAAGPVHPTQRGVRGHAVHTGFQPLGLELRGFLPRLPLVEIAPVTDAPQHRKAPGLGCERKLGRGHHIPHHGAALQIGIAPVAGVVRQTQLGCRKAADALRQRQPLLQGHRCLQVGQPHVHRFRSVHQLQMPADRLPVVARIGAATQRQQGQRACSQTQQECAAPSSRQRGAGEHGFRIHSAASCHGKNRKCSCAFQRKKRSIAVCRFCHCGGTCALAGDRQGMGGRELRAQDPNSRILNPACRA